MFQFKVNKCSLYFIDDEEGNRQVVMYLTTDQKAYIKTKTIITRENYREILKPVQNIRIQEDLQNTLVPVEYDFEQITFLH